MSGDFIDSNIILYAFDEDERKHRIAKEIIADAIAGNASISFQVVQEVLNLLTRRREPSSAGMEPRQVMAEVLLPLWRVMPSEPLYRRALDVQSRYRYAFYDSLIIAAALEAGATRLLSEDLEDGQRIEGLKIFNPFANRGAS